MTVKTGAVRFAIAIGMVVVSMLPAGPGAAVRLQAQSGGTPDPTQLPIATTSQSPLTAAYAALNVASLPAGGVYLDPTTRVKVYKITSATVPSSQGSWHHDYSEGGDEISLPYTGQTRAIHVGTASFGFALLDFTPGGTVGNYRVLAGALKPAHDGCFAFSSNPATPYYAYVINSSALVRIDIRTMTPAPGGGFPVTTSGTWLHQSANDALFTWLDGTTTFGYEPATATMKTLVDANVNEPRLLRGGRYIGLSENGNAAKVWDFTTNTVVFSAASTIPFAHQASLDDRWLGTDWDVSYPNTFWELVPATETFRDLTGPAVGNLTHANGNWVQPGAGANAWALVSTYGHEAQHGWIAPQGMAYVNAAGGRRLLGHPYNNSTDYTYDAFPKQSSDGRYVLFTSDMNGSGRSDLFLVEVPTSNGSRTATIAPAVSITTPVAGATLNGTVTLSATASGLAGISGMQFRANGADIGAEVTTAPYTLNWNSASVVDAAYTLTATARDAAGRSTTSSGLAVSVVNSPPVITGVAVTATTNTTAMIVWTTNQPADTMVEYGLTTAYSGASPLLAPLVTTHSQTLTGLTPGATYHYRARSANTFGQWSASKDFTFVAPRRSPVHPQRPLAPRGRLWGPIQW